MLTAALRRAAPPSIVPNTASADELLRHDVAAALARARDLALQQARSGGVRDSDAALLEVAALEVTWQPEALYTRAVQLVAQALVAEERASGTYGMSEGDVEAVFEHAIARTRRYR